MERRSSGVTGAPDSANGGKSTRPATPPLQPNYSCRKVQKALEHLASIDLTALLNEAKVEHCRATRDFRSCGRYVQSVLNSCGHASLCEECSQRSDNCPLCRTPITKNGSRLCLRLFYECIEAGLISKRCDDRFQEREDGENQQYAVVQRLYSLFDVAMENNLISLICHYVTDVCMDESAVSSDPCVAFLLDEVLVKDWCKRTFKNIIIELQGIYNYTVQGMKVCLGSLLKLSGKLAGISNVLEVLESSFKSSLLARLDDLHQLQESISKTNQHLEMMIWCIRHQFLENVRAQHTDYTLWGSLVRERKADAIKRAWPDSVNSRAGSVRKDGPVLFIEEALSNLDTEQGYTHEISEEEEIASLQKNSGSSYFQFKIEGMAGCYPFENLRAAVDILFLHGSSDLVVAKQSIFLYYLFDRHWTLPDQDWRHVVDDFAATFGISRHSVLESFTFYLLDDHKDEALKEACRLLPEISGPTTHQKVAQVLLERQNPDAALMVLRWSGRDGGAELVSLHEAVTAVRVRLECGLLTEAYMHQRMLCTKVKEKKSWQKSSLNASDECLPWSRWVETLVTEICCLCIRRNLVDRMIELPWNSDEEKHLHKCLLDFAIEDPSKAVGSLLVVFYLQRHHYIEAYQVDRKLHSVEQDYISKNSVSEEVLSRIRSTSDWRAGLAEKGIELLPEVMQRQVKSGKLPEVFPFSGSDVDAAVRSDMPKLQEPIFTTLLANPSVEPSVHRVESAFVPLKPMVLEAPLKTGASVNVSHEFGNYSSQTIPRASFFNSVEKGSRPQKGIGNDFKITGTTTSASSRARDFTRSLSRVPQNRHFQDELMTSVSPEKEHNFINPIQNTDPYVQRVATDSPASLRGNGGLFRDLAEDKYKNLPDKHMPSGQMDGPLNVSSLGDSMDISWSHEGDGPSLEGIISNGGPRWRSDDSSEDEIQPNRKHIKRTRKNRFSRR